ncbi:MAG: M23 family metallopeptidase [Fidelibacterota bacterium]
MAGKKHTLIWLSEDGETTRTFDIHRGTLRAGIAGVVLLILVVAGSGLYLVPRAIDYRRLKGQVQDLMDERLKVARLVKDLSRIEEMDAFIRHLLQTDLEFGGEGERGDTAAFSAPLHGLGFTPVSYLDNIPSRLPATGFVAQDFHLAQAGRKGEHPGLDIAARMGSAVNAAASGLVVFSGWSIPYGNLIILYHGDDFFSMYGHNQRNLVEERQRVERGQLIALVGETGHTTGPHLHFEIWKGDEPVDPRLFIVQYRSKE